jgi:hypothetical protein
MSGIGNCFDTLGMRGGDTGAEVGRDGTSAFVWIEETDKGTEDTGKATGTCMRDAISCDIWGAKIPTGTDVLHKSTTSSPINCSSWMEVIPTPPTSECFLDPVSGTPFTASTYR